MFRKEKPTKLLLWYLNYTCNLSCKYCISKNDREGVTKPTKIEIPKLKNFLNNSNNVLHIFFTGGGEPMLCPNIIEASKEITKKHYLTLTTNLTLPKVREFANSINPKHVKRVIASLHVEELKKKNLLNTYIDNYNYFKKKKFVIEARLVSYPGSLDELKKYKKFFSEKNIKLYFDPYLGSFNGKEYPKDYTKKERKFLGLKKKDVDKFYLDNSYCNAGYNACVIEANGDANLCGYFPNVNLGSIYSDIKFRKEGYLCPRKYCGCPLYDMDKDIFKKSLKHKPIYLKRKSLLKLIVDFFELCLGFIGKIIKKLSPSLYGFLKKK